MRDVAVQPEALDTATKSRRDGVGIFLLRGWVQQRDPRRERHQVAGGMGGTQTQSRDARRRQTSQPVGRDFGDMQLSAASGPGRRRKTKTHVPRAEGWSCLCRFQMGGWVVPWLPLEAPWQKIGAGLCSDRVDACSGASPEQPERWAGWRSRIVRGKPLVGVVAFRTECPPPQE